SGQRGGDAAAARSAGAGLPRRCRARLPAWLTPARDHSNRLNDYVITSGPTVNEDQYVVRIKCCRCVKIEFDIESVNVSNWSWDCLKASPIEVEHRLSKVNRGGTFGGYHCCLNAITDNVDIPRNG